MRVYETNLTYKIVAHVDFRKVDRPAQVCDYLRTGFDANPLQESFWVIMLNRKNHAMSRQMITLGTLTSSLVHPREVFRPAILAGAAAIICAHNHPSGDPAPSAADLQVTRQLREAARAVDIEILDHVIIGEAGADPAGRGYYSFREAGLL
jgi:DNA repair protein RadC